MKSVCTIFRINERGKLGYLAVIAPNCFPKCQTLEQLVGIMANYNVTKLDAVKYFGSDFGEGFYLVQDYNQYFNIKTIRAHRDFSKYVKIFNPTILVNPIEFHNIVFDTPFIHYGNNILCYWQPVFSKCVEKQYLNIDSEGGIVEYNFQQPIFILLNDAKRHIPKVNQETLMINLRTGAITRRVTVATANMYSEMNYVLQGTQFVLVNRSDLPIAGFKLRS